MNLVKIRSILVIVLIAISNYSFSQSTNKQKGDKFYDDYSFSKAIKYYDGIAEKDAEIFRKLANSHRFLGNTEKAEKYYAQCVDVTLPKVNDIYFYSAMLRSNGKFKESDDWMEKFYEYNKRDSRGKEHHENIGMYETLLRDEGRYDIKNLDINTEQEDFGAVFFKEFVVFASSREPKKQIVRRWNWNHLPFLDLYLANPNDSMELENVRKFDEQLNDKFHEGPAAFSNNGDFMTFTRNNYSGKSSDGVIKLELYMEELVGNIWKNEKAFPYNSAEYSIGHSTLTEDGKLMYFASDMPGGYGGVDLYKSELLDTGWSTPVNLGDIINTEGNEMFPFYHESGVLVFASDGHVGLGGLDNFIVEITGSGFGTVQNMGYPLNDIRDDFSVSFDDKMTKGYFSSNRPGGKGDDDIYSFQLLKPFIFGKVIIGVAKDENGSILSDVSVNLMNEEGIVVETITTSEDGTYKFIVAADKDFRLVGTKEKYFEGTNTASTKTTNEEIVVNLLLEKDPGISLYCLVTDKIEGKPILGVKITLENNMTGAIDSIVTPETGDFRRALKDKKINERVSYNLKIDKEGYMSKVLTYNQKLDREGQYNIHEKLDLTMDKMEVGMDIAKIIDINPIYFDVNKSDIRDDASIELDKIVKVMNENLTMEVELGSHTDCRASAKYNESLSDRRAKASAEYIQDKIIDSHRIYGKGYGESELVNKCECEGSVAVPCTDEEHQENRRTEFTIIKM